MRRMIRVVASGFVVLAMVATADAAFAAAHRSGGKAAGSAARSRGVKGIPPGAVLAPVPGDVNARLEKQIAAVKATEDDTARADAAGAMVDAMIGADLSTITPRTVSDVAALLRNEDNMVRYWAALSLAHMGARGAPAAPALEVALRDAERLPEDGPSPAGAICTAFARIGAKPADGRCLEGRYLTAKEKSDLDAGKAPIPAAGGRNVTAPPATAP